MSLTGVYDRIGAWMKLRDGSWGVKLEEEPLPGAVVMVRRRDGMVHTVLVAEVFGLIGGWWVCSVVDERARR